jgi:hypothetical protein
VLTITSDDGFTRFRGIGECGRQIDNYTYENKRRSNRIEIGAAYRIYADSTAIDSCWLIASERLTPSFPFQQCIGCLAALQEFLAEGECRLTHI